MRVLTRSLDRIFSVKTCPTCHFLTGLNFEQNGHRALFFIAQINMF